MASNDHWLCEVLLTFAGADHGTVLMWYCTHVFTSLQGV